MIGNAHEVDDVVAVEEEKTESRRTKGRKKLVRNDNRGTKAPRNQERSATPSRSKSPGGKVSPMTNMKTRSMHKAAGQGLKSGLSSVVRNLDAMTFEIADLAYPVGPFV